ncbi:MAG: SpoIID/LytB domain-containing protein, partial [Lachnospiraceae bacterium]
LFEVLAYFCFFFIHYSSDKSEESMERGVNMGQNMKRGLAMVVIVVLLPYVITVFINGPSIATNAGTTGDSVNVQMASGVVQMSMDAYGMGILASEISMADKLSAVKAQAVLVRTGLYKQIEEERKNAVFREEFWAEADMKKQWGAGKYGEYHKKLEKAWEETSGQIVTYQGKPAATPFHQLSNGSTRIGKEVLGSDTYPYLMKKECPKDVEALEQMTTVTMEKQDMEIQTVDSAGYVQNIRVGERIYTGEEFRKEHALASSCFVLQDYKGNIRVTTKGIGHGLGMSQYTANEMAKEGKSHEEILQYFFEGTEIKEVAEILSNIE